MSGGGKIVMHGDSSSRVKGVEDGFVTVNMKYVEYGEIDPEFVDKFKNELEDLWELIDECGNKHYVQYNKSDCNPFIVDGWVKLREFYQLTANHLVLFGYKGNNKFAITVFKKPAYDFSYPSFHSHSSKTGNIKFIACLTKDNGTKYQLTLDNNFGDYMVGYKYQRVLLLGRVKSWAGCKVLIRRGGKPSVKFGAGWKKFCADND
ncbi:hypothetical protein TSUD_275050 [Trifolium subterraneum]|uniref:TF-B3 domain-containing protein n=1 Tax=Trifolium subterraneum TaxID=3900 RepID=A0A2Z6N7R7_TRISU|nr:hypothetical protein TSUD_275050 [Trifolium subterraneum]